MKMLWPTMVLLLTAGVLLGQETTKGELERSHFKFVHRPTKTEISFGSDVAVLNKLLGNSKLPSDRTTEIDLPGMALKVNQMCAHNEETGEFQVVPDRYLIVKASVSSSSYSTSKGVTMGSKISQVIDAYGEPYAKTDTSFLYVHREAEEVWNLVFFVDHEQVVGMVLVRGD